MTLSAVSIISGAVKLSYPLIPMMATLAPVAEEIILNVDTGIDDGTYELARLTGATIVESKWEWGSIDGGAELARQTQKAIEKASGDFLIYAQADEGLHQDEYDALWAILEALRQAPDIHTVYLPRLYFWGGPRSLRRDWTQPLARLWRRGTRYSAGDAMNTALTPGVGGREATQDKFNLYHYSRMGDPKLIGERIHNLDGLYHPKENLRNPRSFDFKLREFDTHAITENPKEGGLLEEFTGSHPLPFEIWYRERGLWK